ncbi:MAG TPA: hypothetical protein PLE10_01710 [Brevefilum sp.]|nr:hypothetical protein [Brevefilum sp.]HOR18531.1 hypothetical protein [Brevefilum sp.]HPL69074.1 hypothetical protein [Brevefilum sp.]
MNIPYISGIAPPPELPLGRFLPPIPAGMASAWCRENLNPGDWVLEPFGYNPLVVIEMAAAGYPVLACVNNPIHAFLLKTLSSAPQSGDLIAALQDLAVASKGNQRMEPYIRSLYRINCAACNTQIEADAFLWKKDAYQPFAAIVDCPTCGARGEQTLSEFALENLTPLPPKELHLARALNRIAAHDDAVRTHVKNILNAYPARPLIILQTIINKLEGLEQTPVQRVLLIALILSAADYGNTLWAYPSPRHRPRQITVPNVYRERNLWKVMEEAVTTWQVLKAPIPLAEWQGEPEQPEGIYMYQGRIRELTPPPKEGLFSAVLAAIPRPNQAFWSLSALWTGWIWGQEAVAPIRQVLSRQRYDWNWHCTALMGIFDAVYSMKHPSLKFAGLIPENEPLLLLAALLAAEAKGFHLHSFAQSIDDQLAQCQWTALAHPPSRSQPEQALAVAMESVTNYLQKKGEPATFQQVHAAALTGMANTNHLAIDIFIQNTNQVASETHRWLETIFHDPNFLTHVTEGVATIEAGEWWLRHPNTVAMSLIDILEEHIYNHLVSNPDTTAERVKSIAHQALPGIFTPENELVLNCLASYADLVDPETYRWVLKEGDQPAARHIDRELTMQSLQVIAQRLGYQVSGSGPIYWQDHHHTLPRYCLHILTTAVVSPCLWGDFEPAETNILVIPGSRANLLAYKQQRDPVLRDKLTKDFLVVKFRLARDLEVNPLLSRELFKELIRADPPEYHASQLALL